MDEELIFGIVGAVLFGLVGLWLSGDLLGIFGAFVGYFVGTKVAGWHKAKV